nr:hypothetical protein [Candidatus Freyarchaeota archaeon]
MGQLVKDLKYLLYAEREPKEKFSISEFDWDYFKEVTEKMRERIENETPFKYGKYVVTDSGFSFELVDESGMGFGIGLYENVNMEIGLIYTVGSYEMNKTFKFSEMDGDRIVEHLKNFTNRYRALSTFNLNRSKLGGNHSGMEKWICVSDNRLKSRS